MMDDETESPVQARMVLAGTLIEFRERVGMSVRDAALRAGVTSYEIDIWEKGEAWPSESHAVKIGKAYLLSEAEQDFVSRTIELLNEAFGNPYTYNSALGDYEIKKP